MKKVVLAVCLSPLLFLVSCHGKPSDSDISKKILLEYVCAETARVNDLKILSTKDAESFAGLKGYEYQVAGEVEWVNGCGDFGTQIPAGHKEKFESKRVTLIKGEDGVWR